MSRKRGETTPGTRENERKENDVQERKGTEWEKKWLYRRESSHSRAEAIEGEGKGEGGGGGERKLA